MTEEAIFFRRFVADVRRCAGGRAPSAVAEVERRVSVALDAPPAQRERRWARVVGLVNELLAGLDDAGTAAASRLRAFVRENADLGRPRDVAITDFRFTPHGESILTTAAGRRYLVYARIPKAARPATLDEVVPASTKRAVEWAVYVLCGGGAGAALWFAFVVPI